MLFFLLTIALLNVGVGYAIAVYFGRGPHSIGQLPGRLRAEGVRQQYPMNGPPAKAPLP